MRKEVFKLARNYPYAFKRRVYNKVKKIYLSTPRPLRNKFSVVSLVNSRNILND